MVATELPATGRPYAVVTPSDSAKIDDVSAARIIDLYKAHGAILLRGFDVDLDGFRRFASQFCVSSVFNESPDRKLLDDAHNIQSVNGGSAAFPLHPELSREPWKPDACFFCCIVPPREQGATTICDGVALANALPPGLRTALVSRRLAYVQPATPEVLDFWLGTSNPSDAQLASPPPQCPYRFVRTGETVVRWFSRPALHRPMFTEALAFGNFLLFARYYLGRTGFPIFDDGNVVPDTWLEAIKAAGDHLTVPIQWQRGDLLMLDNTRFLHGRTAIVDADQRLIASYFGYLDFAVPNAEEPADPLWRKAAFRPPQPGQPIGRTGAGRP